MPDGKRPMKVFLTAFAGQCSLGGRRGGPDEIGIGHRNTEATSDVIGKKQRLIEFSFTESLNVQRHRYDHIHGGQWRKAGDHEGGKWCRQ